MESENILSDTMDKQIKKCHKNKFKKLQEKQKLNLGIKNNEKWFVNKTSTHIPSDIQWVLSLGKKHATPIEKTNFTLFKFITDGEDLIQTLPDKEDQEISRTKFATMVDNHINKLRMCDRDKYTLEACRKTSRFLKKNTDIIILNADKGNVTVALEKEEYRTKMQTIVGDIMTYRRLSKDPTSSLQKTNNELVNELYNTGAITEAERRKLKTNVSIAPKIYGLPKTHKAGCPLRPIVSCVNSPSVEL